MTRISDWLNRNSMYIALVAAWIAMCGSLYFSEVAGYVPCLLCWYQRILMYPLALFIAIGLLRRDWQLPYYVLPFSVFGLGHVHLPLPVGEDRHLRRHGGVPTGRLVHDAVDQLVRLCDDPLPGADRLS